MRGSVILFLLTLGLLFWPALDQGSPSQQAASRIALAAVTDPANRPYVDVGPDDFVVRFGWWSVHTALSNIEHVEVTGPYHWLKVIGPPHVSLADRGVTFATNTGRGVCIRFREPVTALLPGGLLRHPAITVTVDDVDGLAQAVREHTAGSEHTAG